MTRLLTPFLLCAWAVSAVEPLSSYNANQHIAYLDEPASGYTRIDYAWYLSNSGQTSHCYQNGLIIPSLTEVGGAADAGIFKAWEKQPNASGIKIAVIDSGCNDNNAELSGVVLQGIRIDDRNLIYDGNYSDYTGHGTGVASIIAAKENGQQMVGVAKGAKLLIVRTSFLTSEIAKGITWAVTNGAHIICLSWGETDLTDSAINELYQACLLARNLGVAIVSAVGYGRNLNTNPTYPYGWALPNYVAVAGTTRTGAIFVPSSTGNRCVGAPARVIVQLGLNGVAGYSSGTSYASPIVAGLLALMEAYDPGESMATHITRMKDNAANYPTPGIIGRVNGDQLDK